MSVTRRWVSVAAGTGALVLACGVGWWAGSAATSPPHVAPASAHTSTVTVIDGSIQVDQSYGIRVSWPTQSVGANHAAGTLTSLPPGGKLLHAGDVAYTVDLQPVFVLSGSVPSFRTLGVGVSGADVHQLESFLVAAHYLSGRADDVFDAATKAAVNRWWESAGLPASGDVPAGRIVFVPTLPAYLGAAPDVAVGQSVSPGASVLVQGKGKPQFTFRVLPEMVQRTKPGLSVSIDAGNSVWKARVARLAADPNDASVINAVLEPVTGETICGEQCSQIPLGADEVLPGVLTLVPQTHGPQIPTAAVRTGAAGQTCVVLDGGERRAVTVKATNQGMSIVEGLPVGARVVVGGSQSC